MKGSAGCSCSRSPSSPSGASFINGCWGWRHSRAGCAGHSPAWQRLAAPAQSSALPAPSTSLSREPGPAGSSEALARQQGPDSRGSELRTSAAGRAPQSSPLSPLCCEKGISASQSHRTCRAARDTWGSSSPARCMCTENKKGKISRRNHHPDLAKSDETALLYVPSFGECR